MFENTVVKGVHASRYIMSYIRMGGKITKRAGASDFEEWLESLEMTDEEIQPIMNMALNGKMELETSAAKFLKNIKTE